MTIAQQLNITPSEFPFSIKNKAGREIYREIETGRWTRKEWDARGNKTRHEDSDGYWNQNVFDTAGNLISQSESDGRWKTWQFNANNKVLRYANSEGDWTIFEYNEAGAVIYCESQLGVRIDCRPQPVILTHAEIAEKLGIPGHILKIIE